MPLLQGIDVTYLAGISWISAAAFSLQVLVITLLFLCLSGHFPFAHQQPKLKELPGRLLMAASVLLGAISVAQVIGFANRQLPIPVAIICAGLALLVAPLVLQRLPESFVEGRRGLAALAALAATMVYLMTRLLAAA